MLTGVILLHLLKDKSQMQTMADPDELPLSAKMFVFLA